MKKTLLLIIILILMTSMVGCSKDLETGKSNMILTQDFGNEKIYDEELNFTKDTTVMELMQSSLDVKIENGFIDSINGIETEYSEESKQGWFYYINGNLAQVGPENYHLNSGDDVLWDYHTWENEIYISSIIGSYPKNFTNGYDGKALKTEIIYSDQFKEETDKLYDYLKDNGADDLVKKTINERYDNDEKINTVLIGTWSEISKINNIKDVYNDKQGELFFKIDDKVKALDCCKNVSKEFEKAAVIASVPKGYSYLSNIWIVTGNDEDMIKKALNILYENPEKIKGKFSAIVTDEEVVNIPVSR
ncbi:DUF4430 domain-containing protein [Tepidibacter aestuarii]|uniref:DUF4430 domain-containing protein n=1 Tax=Tepidibacter aestuarii TaxID=2925782 RepID=UPI0020BE1DA0|nr:DUF4430 domain-containing protein [Tepidibacter aestuarii]CAH2215048.1 DUF4430 domain-containing protein [Tepidibacter aestuarii]